MVNIRVVAKLKTIFPNSDINPVILDLTNPLLIIETIRNQIKPELQIDYLICSESCMPLKPGLTTFTSVWKCLLYGSITRMISTGR